MGNLIKMDLYRMRKGKTLLITLLIAVVISFAQTPVLKLLSMLMNFLGGSDSSAPDLFPATATLASFFRNPFPLIVGMLVLISASNFFFADLANGYIKNIAGQMPKRGYTVLSKFIAILPHNLLFMVLCVLANLAGSIIFQKITPGADLASAIGTFFLKMLLMQAVCAILLFVTTALRNKSLSTVVAVLVGLGLLGLVYLSIDSLIGQVFKTDFSFFETYMPDQLLSEDAPKALDSILSSLVTGGLFLLLAINVFDRRDVK